VKLAYTSELVAGVWECSHGRRVTWRRIAVCCRPSGRIRPHVSSILIPNRYWVGMGWLGGHAGVRLGLVVGCSVGLLQPGKPLSSFLFLFSLSVFICNLNSNMF
jgi:hypothetical protein